MLHNEKALKIDSIIFFDVGGAIFKPGPQQRVVLLWPATDLIVWHFKKEEKLEKTRNSGNSVRHTQEKASTQLSIVFSKALILLKFCLKHTKYYLKFLIRKLLTNVM